MGKRGRKAKGADAKKQEQFESLGGEWCDAIKSMDTDKIKLEIGKVATNSFILAMARKQDQHLQELKDQVKQADAGYKEGLKTNDIRIEFMITQLNYRGVNIPSIQDLIGNVADGETDG